MKETVEFVGGSERYKGREKEEGSEGEYGGEEKWWPNGGRERGGGGGEERGAWQHAREEREGQDQG